MHDRAVRRRRAVLLALIAASLVLLTAYFGESDNGSLRSFQRGAMAVFVRSASSPAVSGPCSAMQ